MPKSTYRKQPVDITSPKETTEPEPAAVHLKGLTGPEGIRILEAIKKKDELEELEKKEKDKLLLEQLQQQEKEAKMKPLEARITEITKRVDELHKEMMTETAEKVERRYLTTASQMETTFKPVLEKYLKRSQDAKIKSEKATQIPDKNKQHHVAKRALESAREKARKFIVLITANNKFLIELGKNLIALQEKIDIVQGEISHSELKSEEMLTLNTAKEKLLALLSQAQDKIRDIDAMIKEINHLVESIETNCTESSFVYQIDNAAQRFIQLQYEKEREEEERQADEEKRKAEEEERQADELKDLENLSSYHIKRKEKNNNLKVLYDAARMVERSLGGVLQKKHNEMLQLYICYGFYKKEIETFSSTSMTKKQLSSAQSSLKKLDLLYRKAAQTQKTLAISLYRINYNIEGDTSVRTHLIQLREEIRSLDGEISQVRTEMIQQLSNTRNSQIKDKVLRKIEDEIARIEDSKKKYENTDNDRDGTLATAKKDFLQALWDDIYKIEIDDVRKDIYAEIAHRVKTAKEKDTYGQAKEKRTHHKSAIVKSSLFDKFRSKTSSTEQFVDNLEKDMNKAASPKGKTK